MNVAVCQDNDVPLVDKVLKGIGDHLAVNGFEIGLADVDGGAVDLVVVEFGWQFVVCVVEGAFGVDEGLGGHLCEVGEIWLVVLRWF